MLKQRFRVQISARRGLVRERFFWTWKSAVRWMKETEADCLELYVHDSLMYPDLYCRVWKADLRNRVWSMCESKGSSTYLSELLRARVSGVPNQVSENRIGY